MYDVRSQRDDVRGKREDGISKMEEEDMQMPIAAEEEG